MFPELSGDETGQDGRYVKTATYTEYLEEAAKKILNTRRFRYATYSEWVGVDFLYETGRMQSGISLAVINTQAQEALEAHIEVESAEVTDNKVEGNRILFSLEIEGIRGKTRMEVNTWQR